MNSGLFPKRINITPVIVTYQIIKIVDDWGGGEGGSRRDQYEKSIYICNRNNYFLLVNEEL